MRVYDGLAGEVDAALELAEQLRRYLQHWSAAGVRAPLRTPGANSVDRMNEVLRELTVLRAAVENAQPTGAGR